MLSKQVTKPLLNAAQPQVAPSQSMSYDLSLTKDSSEFLSVKEVARHLGVATVSVYRLAERRALPVYRVLRKLLFRRSDVLAWLESKRFAPRDPALWP